MKELLKKENLGRLYCVLREQENQRPRTMNKCHKVRNGMEGGKIKTMLFLFLWSLWVSILFEEKVSQVEG